MDSVRFRGPQAQPQVAAQQFAQAQPGAQAPPKQNSGNGALSSKRLSDLKPEELSKLGGGSSLEKLAQLQGDLTVAQASPLLRNSAALDSIVGLMSDRNDLRVEDFLSKGPKGKINIDPSYKDPKAMEILKERQDLNPSDLSSMRANFTKQFKNPHLGKEASGKALELLKKRPDLDPEQAQDLMKSITKAVGIKGKGPGGKIDPAAAGAALDTFDKASKLLEKRTDITADQAGELAQSVGKLGAKNDPKRGAKVAEGFASAAKALEKNPLREAHEMGSLAETIGEHFKGKGEKAGAARMKAFSDSSKMLGEQTHVGPGNVNKFLEKASERNPKIAKAGGAKKAQLLGGALAGMTDGVSKGMVDPNNLNSFFGSSAGKSMGFQPPKGQSQAKPGQSPQRPGSSAGPSASAPAGAQASATGSGAATTGAATGAERTR